MKNRKKSKALIISGTALITAVLLFLFFGGMKMNKKAVDNIFPEVSEARVVLPGSVRINGKVCFGNYPEDFYPETMNEKLENVMDVEEVAEDKAALLYVYDRDAFEKKGSYSLNTEASKTVLTYSDGEGAYHGTVTLCNILKDNKGRMPKAKITDIPDAEIRGYSLDMARDRVPTSDSLKQLVLDLSDLKMNLLMVYLEMPSSVELTEEEKKIEDSVLTLSSLGTGLTTEELKEFDEFARKHYVEAVPFIETVGHLWGLLRYELYAPVRETPGFCNTIAMQNPEAQKLMDRWIEILSGCFSGDYFMIGGDESGEVGKGQSINGTYTSHVTGEVIKTRSEAYIDSLCITYNIVKKYKPEAKVLVWHDMMTGICSPISLNKASEVMPDVIPCIWSYEAGSGEFEEEIDFFSYVKSWDYWLCPSTNSFTSVTGRLTRCENNVNNCVKCFTGSDKAKGLLLTNWGDGGQKERMVSDYTGIAYGAGKFRNCDSDNKKAYDYVADNIFGDKKGELTEKWVALQRENDLFTHSWGCGWLAKVGYESYQSVDMLSAFLYYQTARGKYTFDDTISSLEKITAMARDVAETLQKTELNCERREIIEAEINLVCNMTIYYGEYDLLRLRLIRPAYEAALDEFGDMFLNDIIGEAKFREKILSCCDPSKPLQYLPEAAKANGMREEDLIAKAEEMADFSVKLFDEYEKVWYMANKKGGFEDSFMTLKSSEALFTIISKGNKQK